MVAVDVNTTNSTSNIDLEGKESKDDDSHSTTGDFLLCTEWFYLRDSFLSFQQVVLHQNQVILRYCVTVCKQSKCDTFSSFQQAILLLNSIHHNLNWASKYSFLLDATMKLSF